MAETVVVEIFEYECKSSSGWIPDPNLHWCLKSTKEQEQQCQAPEEYVISDKNFAWTSNWRIDKKQYVTDNDGYVIEHINLLCMHIFNLYILYYLL